jgi:hypothetical protein
MQTATAKATMANAIAISRFLVKDIKLPLSTPTHAK